LLDSLLQEKTAELLQRMSCSFLIIFLLSCYVFLSQAFNTSDNADFVPLADIKAKLDVIGQVVINTTLENPVKGNDVHKSIDSYASMIDIHDEVALDDEALVLAHIESDIEDFEDLKKTITFLEKSVRKHADSHVVKSQELLEVNRVLHELDEKVVTSFEQELRSLKGQISKLDHKFDNSSMKEIATIVENAEKFLQVSMDKIEELEMIEHEWDVTEESVKIQHMIDQDEAAQYGTKIILESLKPSDDDGPLNKKWSLSDQIITVVPPTSMQLNVKLQLDGDSLYEKLKKSYPMKKSKNQNNLGDVRYTYSDAVIVTKGSQDSEVLNDSDSDSSDSDESDGSDSDVDEVLETSVFDEIVKNKEYIKHWNKGNFEAVVSDESLENNNNKGSLYASFVKDPVSKHYSSEVEGALNTAKETSHKFLENRLGHQETIVSGETVVKNEQTSLMPYLHFIILVLLLMVLLLSCFAYRVIKRRRRAATVTVAFQNLSGFGGNDICTAELETIKEDGGWGKYWRASHKMKQNKFR